MKVNHRLVRLIITSAGLFAIGNAFALNLIHNGGFEVDASFIQSPDPINNWTAHENGIFGGVLITSDTTSAVSGSSTVGAVGGHYYALFDLAAPSQMALAQTFSVGSQGLNAAQLSFAWFVNYSGAETGFTYNPSGLDFTTSNTNQNFRVDILHANATAFSTSANDVVASYMFSPTLSSGPNHYSVADFSGLESVLQANQSYQLRFAGVGNTGQMQIGIDNISLQVTPVPEPATYAMLVSGLLLVGAVARRRIG